MIRSFPLSLSNLTSRYLSPCIFYHFIQFNFIRCITIHKEEIKNLCKFKIFFFFFFKFSRYRLKCLQLSPRFHFSLCGIFERGICFHYFYSQLEKFLFSRRVRNTREKIDLYNPILILKKGKKFNEKLQNFKFMRTYMYIYMYISSKEWSSFKKFLFNVYLTSLTFRNRLQSFSLLLF